MTKKQIDNDPQYKIKGNKTSVNARQTPQLRRFTKFKTNYKRWTVQQHSKYIHFIKMNQDKFLEAKKFKIFTLMAGIIKSRSSQQCKSHHVKMVLKFDKSIDKLIRFLQSKVEIESSLNQRRLQERQTVDMTSTNQQRLDQNFAQNQNLRLLQIFSKEQDLKNSEKDDDFCNHESEIFCVLSLG